MIDEYIKKAPKQLQVYTKNGTKVRFLICYLTLGEEITEMTSTVAHVITDSLSFDIMQEYCPASFMAAFLIWSTEEVSPSRHRDLLYQRYLRFLPITWQKSLQSFPN